MNRRIRIRTLTAGLILLVGSAPPGATYLLENFEFPNDLSGWTPGNGAWSHDPSLGFLGLGAAKVTSVVGANSLSQRAELKGMATEDALRFLAFARAENHTNPVQVSLEVVSTTDCTGGAVETYHRQVDSPAMGSWNQINVVNSLPVGSVFSVRAWVTAHARRPRYSSGVGGSRGGYSGLWSWELLCISLKVRESRHGASNTLLFWQRGVQSVGSGGNLCGCLPPLLGGRLRGFPHYSGSCGRRCSAGRRVGALLD